MLTIYDISMKLDYEIFFNWINARLQNLKNYNKRAGSDLLESWVDVRLQNKKIMQMTSLRKTGQTFEDPRLICFSSLHVHLYI